MSYTPIIIISKADIEKSKKRIEDEFYLNEDNEVNKYLWDALNMEPVMFKKLRLIFIEVNITATNKEVRQRLTDLGIPYAVYF